MMTGAGPLTGKAIVFTGAGRGIGAACARYAASAGAELIVNDIDQDVLDDVVSAIVGEGGRALAHRADVADWNEAEALIDRCVTEYGKIDGLLNNAGIVRLARPEEETEESLRRVIGTNLLGSAFCGVHAIRRMLVQGSGNVVNVASGSQAGWNLMGAYGASKGGIASLTYCWAMDLVGTGVRVNAVSPVATTRLLDHFAEYLGPAYTPKPGGIDPSANAPVVAYLLSDASSPLNGQVVRIEGEELSMVSHPAILHPSLRRRPWTFDDVAEAFAEGRLAPPQPLGMVAGASQFTGQQRPQLDQADR